MLVVGAATGIRRWLPGSVSRLCEARSPCAVVVVRKDTQVVPRRLRPRG
jgi:nucleotide-binding universal stress UspA family protein